MFVRPSPPICPTLTFRIPGYSRLPSKVMMMMILPRRVAFSTALSVVFVAIGTICVDVDAFAAPSALTNGVSFPSSSSVLFSSYLDSLGSHEGSNGKAASMSPPGGSASSAPGRLPIIAGNWKLNPATLSDAANLCQGLASKVADASTVEVVVFPPFPYLSTAISMLEGTGIKVGAQNCALQTSGAHTGEVAVSMIRSLGCDYVLLGHSERRSIYGETETDINTKVHLCLEEDPNLGVILCVGETEEEYDSGLLRSIVDVQIKKGLSKVTQTDLSRIVIAYEPVWAIGTGKVATPEQTQIAHEAVRQTLADMFGAASQAVRIQYGGSVTPESIDSLIIMPDVDGALVGGASLSADSFARIVGGGAAAGL